MCLQNVCTDLFRDILQPCLVLFCWLLLMKNQTTKRAKKHQNGVIDELKKWKERKEEVKRKKRKKCRLRIYKGEWRGEIIDWPSQQKRTKKNLSFLIWLSWLPSCKSLLKTRKKENYRNLKWRIQYHSYYFILSSQFFLKCLSVLKCTKFLKVYWWSSHLLLSITT